MLRKFFKPVLKILARNLPHYKVRTALLRMASYRIGRDVFIGEEFLVRDERNDLAMVTIGDRVAIADRVTLVVSSNANYSRIRPVMGDVHLPIQICDDAWLGAGCIIFPGVRIGRGAVVGAGSVVTKSVPDLTIVVGSPARAIRTIDPSAIDDV